MKKSILLFAIFLSLTTMAQESVEVIQFPQSFKLNHELLPDYQLFQFEEEMKQKGFKENPAVIKNKDLMKLMEDNAPYIPSIDAIYYEIYTKKDDEYSGAGVQVYNFDEEKSLDHYLADEFAQPNYAVLTFHKHYLIKVWCDDGRNGREKLNQLIAYYQDKLGAELQTLTENTARQAEIEEAVQEAADAVDAAAAVDMEEELLDTVLDSSKGTVVSEIPTEESKSVKDEIGEKPVAAPHKMSRKTWSDYELDRLETYNPDFTYAMYDKLIASGYIVWLVERYGQDEQIHWAVLFDTGGNYKGFQQIAYENSEGNVRKYAVITGDKIRVYKESIYDNDAVQSFEDFIMTSEGFKR